jgi:hypothetical protein
MMKLELLFLQRRKSRINLNEVRDLTVLLDSISQILKARLQALVACRGERLLHVKLLSIRTIGVQTMNLMHLLPAALPSELSITLSDSVLIFCSYTAGVLGITVNSDKTLLGEGSAGIIKGKGLRMVSGVSNIIIQ